MESFGIISAKPESFLNGIFQQESLRKYALAGDALDAGLLAR
jgi:hypothetical protein